MGFLVSILFVVLFFVLLIFLFVLGFLRSIFKFGKRKNAYTSENKENTYQQQKQRNKVFDKNEGEYADFEEIK
jgi:uncharacterized protein HemY